MCGAEEELALVCAGGTRVVVAVSTTPGSGGARGPWGGDTLGSGGIGCFDDGGDGSVLTSIFACALVVGSVVGPCTGGVRAGVARAV